MYKIHSASPEFEREMEMCTRKRGEEPIRCKQGSLFSRRAVAHWRQDISSGGVGGDFHVLTGAELDHC